VTGDAAQNSRISAGMRLAMQRRVMTSIRSAFVLLFTFVGAVPLVAQDLSTNADRAQQASAQRDEKAARLTPPQRSQVERALYWYDMNGARLRWRMFHVSGGSFPGGAGFGYGLGATVKAMGSALIDPQQPNRIDGDFFAARSVRGYQRIAARMDVRNVADRPVDFNVRWQDYRLPQEDFYGAGPNSASSARTNYRLDGNEFAAGLTWRPNGALAIGSELFYLTPLVGSGTDDRYPTTEARHDETDAPGLSGLPAFVRGDVSVTFDWRDNDTHPRRGGSYRATFSRYEGVNNEDYEFQRLDISAQQIIPIASRYRRVALDAAMALTSVDAGTAVPFIYQPAVGGPATLRGYSGSRFRDRNAAWARAEYQWEAWWALDAALFVDAGTVEAHRSDFTLENVEVTYGVGFRLHSNTRFIARLDLAYGREGFLPILGFKYGF
jgi:hypothetical protein